MKNENYTDIKCPDWLVNLYKKKEMNKNKGINKKNIIVKTFKNV